MEWKNLDKEESWDNTEELVQKLIKDKLGGQVKRRDVIDLGVEVKSSHLMIDLTSISLELDVTSHALSLLILLDGRKMKNFWNLQYKESVGCHNCSRPVQKSPPQEKRQNCRDY